MKLLPGTVLLFVGSVIAGHGQVSTVTAPAPGAPGEGKVWIALLPKSPIRSIREYHHIYRTYPLPTPPLYTPLPLPACELEIRRAQDQTRVGRIPYAGYFRESGELNESDARRLSPLPDGQYWLALCEGDVRCSNVAVLVVDGDYDPLRERPLRLVSIEPAPGQELRYLGVQGTGPSPADPKFGTWSVHCPDLIVDGVPRSLTEVFGSFFDLGPGQQFMSIIDLSRYRPDITSGTAQAVRAVAGRYESQPVRLSVQTPLGEAWDRATPTLPRWREREPALRGTVIGTDGKPGDGYEVNLVRGEQRHQEKCATDGTFAFLNVPAGVYRLEASPPGTAPGITIEELRVPENQTLVRDLSFERLFSFSGKVTRQDGAAIEGKTVMATWKSPDGTTEFVDCAVTDAHGSYTLSAPFKEAVYVGIAGTGQQPRPHRNVTAGRKDVDFSF